MSVSTAPSPQAGIQSWMTSSDRSMRSVTKSSPIAIKRSASGNYGKEPDSDDDSDDAPVSLEEKMDRLTVGSLPTKKRGFAKKGKGAMAKSMPLRAPRLGSMALPNQSSVPPMSLPEADVPALEDDVQTSTYGSLRDSHFNGRFLDGPMSYRDARSGQIRMLQHHKQRRATGGDGTSNGEFIATSLPQHFGQISSSIGDWSRVAPGISLSNQRQQKQNQSLGALDMMDPGSKGIGLTPGERMRQSPKTSSLGNGGTPPLSKVADLLDGESLQSQEKRDTKGKGFSLLSVTQQHHLQQQLQPPLQAGAPSSMMLSTSLTGLELLESGNVRGLHHYQLPSSTAQGTALVGAPGVVAQPHLAPYDQHPNRWSLGDEHGANNDDDTIECFDLDL